mmetsp:Transcript_97203/g.296931  ORF Transcript_97203/g.296931 Transcript_97203/m.296931 type:complete len:233 (-) Transcript_97203:553-1251(-)
MLLVQLSRHARRDRPAARQRHQPEPVHPGDPQQGMRANACDPERSAEEEWAGAVQPPLVRLGDQGRRRRRPADPRPRAQHGGPPAGQGGPLLSARALRQPRPAHEQGRGADPGGHRAYARGDRPVARHGGLPRGPVHLVRPHGDDVPRPAGRRRRLGLAGGLPGRRGHRRRRRLRAVDVHAADQAQRLRRAGQGHQNGGKGVVLAQATSCEDGHGIDVRLRPGLRRLRHHHP